MNKVTGGTLPAAAWRSFMLAATARQPVEPLPAAPPAPVVPEAASPLDTLLSGLGLAPGTRVPAPPSDRLPGPATVSDTR